MHRILIIIACIMAFMLMSVPVMAADFADVDVDLDVEGCWKITNHCSNLIEFTIGCTEFESHWSRPSGDPSHIKIWSNQPYNVYIEHDNPSGWSGTGWQFWTKENAEVPSNHSGSYEIKATATALYWGSNQPAVDEKNWYFYYLISGIDYADNWVAHTDMELTYTLATSI